MPESVLGPRQHVRDPDSPAQIVIHEDTWLKYVDSDSDSCD